MQWSVLSWPQACLTVARSCHRLEFVWAGDCMMPAVDSHTRTHIDSIDLLVDNAADENSYPRWFAPYVAIFQSEEPKIAHSERMTSRPFWRKKKWYHFATLALKKRCTFVSRLVMYRVRSCLLVVSLKGIMTAQFGSRTLMQSYVLKKDTGRS